MTPLPLEPLAPRRPTGRVFAGRRKVRLGDVDPEGRLRLDALTRYTQDVSDDDTTDAGLDPEPGWVVRSTVVDELAPARLGDQLVFETFCSGLGGRWAERRLTITGPAGAHYEVATLWVCIDAESGRPHRLTEQFQDLYGEAAGDRKVSARQVNPNLGDTVTDPITGRPWQVRRADLDVYGHVNNAAYWAAVEQWAAPWSVPRRARLEYGGGLTEVDEVDIVVAPFTPAAEDDDRGHGGDVDRDDQAITTGLAMWWLSPSVDGDGSDPSDAASASVVDLPAALYR